MKGSHQIIVQNRRVQYKFTLQRNITVLRGDSATGKTTLIDMIESYQNNGEQSGITISSDKKCVVLTSAYWQNTLEQIKDSIVFIDEGAAFVTSKEFALMAKNSDNYYVIATRTSLYELPYSITEIYGIKSNSGNRYQGTKRIYSSFYPLYNDNIENIPKPDIVIVEDSKAGFEFFKSVSDKYEIECVSAQGKSNVYNQLLNLKAETALVIADGAAFGPEIERVLSLKTVKNFVLYLPESFEWLVLKSGLISNVEKELDSTSEYVESSKYFSWEQFFTDLLTEKTSGTYLQYSKNKLNEVYLHPQNAEQIIDVVKSISNKNN